MKKNKKYICFILIVIALLTVSCSNNFNNEKNQYVSISAKEGYDMMKDDPDIVLIDVRTKQEFDSGHIPKSINIPDFEITSVIETIVKDKNQTIILYCRSGKRSRQAALKLIDMGYRNVYDMGGILDWPYETVLSEDD